MPRFFMQSPVKVKNLLPGILHIPMFRKNQGLKKMYYRMIILQSKEKVKIWMHVIFIIAESIP